MSNARRLLLEFETEEVGVRARKNKKMRKALIRAFSDPSEIVRERALIAAIDLGDASIVTDIRAPLDDDNADVRVAAAQALAWYHQPRTIPALIHGLKDSNTWVRSHCALGLSKLLHGPIWARIPGEDIDIIHADFPEMDEDHIRRFLHKLELSEEAVDQFLMWKSAKFEIEIDESILIKETEGKPIILAAAMTEAAEPARDSGLSEEVETILSELPDEVRASLPSEDLRRLTPTTARELVTSLTAEKPKKKAVRVKRVKRVRKKKKKILAREQLIEKIPSEVRETVSEDVLESLSTDELEALVAATPEVEEAEPTVEEPKKKKRKKKEPVEALPPVDEEEVEDLRWQQFADRYGEEKADLLITVSPEMLEGIPQEQIVDMDTDTLKSLVQALEPR
ncbi:MAG: HEAT repeat domain-containing protein [Candidatus Thorarchaeota archaeon]|nr:HEAT repeat domain-containing protein [Candidatus Thorarchaeota archaeon]